MSNIVLNNESGSIDLKFTPVLGKDKFEIWISQYPGEITPEDFKDKSETILSSLIKNSLEPEAKPETYSDSNVYIDYVTVADKNYEPYKPELFQYITQGMAKYRTGFVVFSFQTMDKNNLEQKFDIIKSMIINKK